MSDTSSRPKVTSRAVWELIEPIHAVTYFAEACRDAMDDLGLKGFWMGYVAARSAPLGACSPALVEATFFNFAPARIRRAVPDAWTLSTTDVVLDSRSSAAAIALRQLAPDADEHARRALPLLESAVSAARCEGRPLAAANQRVSPPSDPVARLWQATTTLREHRGDGHVASLVSAGIGGIEALVLAAAAAPGAADAERLREARGWTTDEWDLAVGRLRGRGLLDDRGTATDQAHVLHAQVEQRTDDAAWQPFEDGLTPTGLDLLVTVLRPFAAAVVRSGMIPFPNPIGLPQRAASPPR